MRKSVSSSTTIFAQQPVMTGCSGLMKLPTGQRLRSGQDPTNGWGVHIVPPQRRRCHAPPSKTLLVSFLLALLILSGANAQSNIHGQCYGHLFASDANQNKFLSSTEFADAVRRVSYGAVNVPYTSLPPSLLAAFATNSQGGAGVSIAGTPSGITPTMQLDGLCDSIYSGILVALSVDVQFQRCFLFMSIADQNPRNSALARDEYPRFVNAAADYSLGIVPFNALALPVQLVFDDFADATDTVNIEGTRPGTQPTPQREPVLQSFCRQTYVAIEAGENAVTPTPTEAPVEYEFSFLFCTTAMAASDISSDSQMDSAEYARFINIVSGNAFPERQFDLLPTVLRQNFISNAGTLGFWNVQGSRPGTQATPAQENNLLNLCDATRNALNSDPDPEPTQPTLSPACGEVETLPYVQCTLSMATSDSDRSNTLSEEEYVSFLNRVQSFEWRDFVYADLPFALQANFEALSASSVSPGIDVAGSFPGQPPNTIQRAFLERICLDTAVAIDAVLDPCPTPSPSVVDPDATLAPTFTGKLIVYSAFIIASKGGTNFTEIFPQGDPTNRDNLEAAYGDLVRDVVSDLVTDSPPRLRLRRRLVLNGVVDDSPGLYLFQATDCPAGVDSPFCQEVYGSFEVDVENEPESLRQQLSLAVQTALAADQGGLQSFLDNVQPDAPILVAGVPADGIVRPSTPSPTPSPRSGDDNDGLGVGALIGIIAGGVVFCCGCAYCIFASDTNPLDFLDDMLPKRQPKRKDTDGSGRDLDEDDNPTMDKDDQPSSPPQRSSILGGALGIFDTGGKGSPKEAEEKENTGFSIQEQSPAKGSRLGSFGFGKKDSGDEKTPTSPMGGDHESVADYSFNDLAGDQKDWNPQQPPLAEDPWKEHEGASGSSSSDDDEDDGTGYGDSDSESEDRDTLQNDQGSQGDDYGEDYSDNYEDDQPTVDDHDGSTLNESGNLGAQNFGDMEESGTWNETNLGSQGFGESDGFGSSFNDPQSPSQRSRSRSSRGTSGASSMNSQKREYLERVRELVSLVVPDEVDNVPAMMEQFAGREEELINTLQTMYERSSSTRPRRAVHRSKGIPDEAGRFTAGTADGTAAVAAASTIGQSFDSFSQSQSYTSSQQESSYATSQEQSYADSQQESYSYSQQESYAGQSEQESYAGQEEQESYTGQSEDYDSRDQSEGSFLDDADDYESQDYDDDYDDDDPDEYESQDYDDAGYDDDDYDHQRSQSEYYDDGGQESYDDGDGEYDDSYSGNQDEGSYDDGSYEDEYD